MEESEELGLSTRPSDLPAFFGPPITGEQRQSAWLSRSRVLLGQREPASPASAHRHPSQAARHASVRHSVGSYVDGQVHTNGIESFWVKHRLHGYSLLLQC